MLGGICGQLGKALHVHCGGAEKPLAAISLAIYSKWPISLLLLCEDCKHQWIPASLFREWLLVTSRVILFMLLMLIVERLPSI